jgi:Flp pilus assembly protein TadD
MVNLRDEIADICAYRRFCAQEWHRMNGLQFHAGSGWVSVAFSAPILLVLAAGAFGAGTNSAARATTPPSSYQNGLIDTSHPMDQSGNLAITGNLPGGQHFRGNVPYRSTNSFGAPLGSTSLDSFLRYSTVPEGLTGYPQNYSPYYSSTRTVTTTSPGYSGIFTAPSPKIADGLTPLPMDRTTATMSMAEIPQRPTLTDDLAADAGSMAWQPSRLPSWPAPTGLGDAKVAPSDETSGLSIRRPSGPLDDPLMPPQEYQRRLQVLLDDLERARQNASQIEQRLDVGKTEAQSQPPAEAVPSAGEVTGLTLYDPSVRSDNSLQAPPACAGEIRPSVMDFRGDSVAQPASLATTLQRVSEYAARLQAASGTDRTPQGPALPDFSPAETASAQQPPAEAVPQTSENGESITQQQFDRYLTAAELSARQGRYDRAAESFALASVYVPHDVRPHLGKSHALLAVGDFVNSVLSLARAIELDARAGLARVDLVEAVGGPDAFVARIAKLEELAQDNPSPAFQFLLAYVYYQMDRPNEARVAIEAARTGMVSRIAVDRLAAAINQ